jgi:hypothetical protein
MIYEWIQDICFDIEDCKRTLINLSFPVSTLLLSRHIYNKIKNLTKIKQKLLEMENSRHIRFNNIIFHAKKININVFYQVN